MRLASRFSLADVVKHTRERLELADEYSRLTRQDDDGWSPATFVMKVPSTGGSLVERPFRKLSVLELNAAVDHQRSLVEANAQRTIPDALIMVDHLKRALHVPEVDTQLATFEATPSRSGQQADAVMRLTTRYADLVETVRRLAIALDIDTSRARQRG